MHVNIAIGTLFVQFLEHVSLNLLYDLVHGIRGHAHMCSLGQILVRHIYIYKTQIIMDFFSTFVVYFC